MTNNMKAMELSDEQLALVSGGHGGSNNSGNVVNNWQNTSVWSDTDINNNCIYKSSVGNVNANNVNLVWQSTYTKKVYPIFG